MLQKTLVAALLFASSAVSAADATTTPAATTAAATTAAAAGTESGVLQRELSISNLISRRELLDQQNSIREGLASILLAGGRRELEDELDDLLDRRELSQMFVSRRELGQQAVVNQGLA